MAILPKQRLKRFKPIKNQLLFNESLIPVETTEGSATKFTNLLDSLFRLSNDCNLTNDTEFSDI